MEKLKLIGNQNIAGYEFTGIEGGFGEGKKCMLVRDIAKIHNQPLGEINRRINENISRFKKDIDIIDIKSAMVLNHSEINMTQNAWNASKNIYVLSERGYSKLLKIMDDDLAWEIYDKFVDEYFNMRNKIKDLNNDSKKISDKTPVEILRDNGVALNDLFDSIGLSIPKELVVSTAITTTKNMTGYEFEEVKLLLNKQDEEEYNSASGILKDFGIKRNRTNETLVILGLQVKGNTTMQPYVLTDLGKKFGVERSYTNNSHQGYEIKWKGNLVNFLHEHINEIPEEFFKK